MSAGKREIVVYVPAQDGKFKFAYVDFGMSETSLRRHQIALENGGSVDLGRVAFLHLTFGEVSSKQEAADVARVRNLRFIPENILAGMRKRQPGITMDEILKDFNVRVAAYEAPQQTTVKPRLDELEELDLFKDLMENFCDIFGKPFPK